MSAMRLMRLIIALLLMAGMLAGCGGKDAPRSFTVTQRSHWSSIELREDLDYEQAWDTVLEIVIRNFDLMTAIRQEGYIRTDWQHTWSGQYDDSYRVRVVLKFNPQRTILQFRPEAQYQSEDKKWILGTDSRLIKDLKADLMGTVGRAVR